MTTTTSAPAATAAGAHHAVHNPYAVVWADAAARIATLMAQVHDIGATLESAQANLNWQGGSERYFAWQAGRQQHYLQTNTSELLQLRVWMARAGAAGVVAKPTAGGAA